MLTPAHIRDAANRLYLAETAAEPDEPDDAAVRARSVRLGDALNDVLKLQRTGNLSRAAARLMEAMEKAENDGTQLRSRASVAGSLPVASRGGLGRRVGSNPTEGNLVEQPGSSPHGLSPRRPHERAPVPHLKGGRHENLDRRDPESLTSSPPGARSGSAVGAGATVGMGRQ